MPPLCNKKMLQVIRIVQIRTKTVQFFLVNVCIYTCSKQTLIWHSDSQVSNRVMYAQTYDSIVVDGDTEKITGSGKYK